MLATKSLPKAPNTFFSIYCLCSVNKKAAKFLQRLQKKMSATLFISTSAAFKHPHQSTHFLFTKTDQFDQSFNSYLHLKSPFKMGYCGRSRIHADTKENGIAFIDGESQELSLRRRSAILSGFSLLLLDLAFPGDGLAIKQGLLAGRIPGLSEPDERGWRTYRRPDEKSGGHGVGWSPIIPYAFTVPQGWEEVPVSIADLGGTEIDLRFASSKEGRLSVIVAPVLRFADLGDNVTIEKIGPPDRVISAFGPEVIGENVDGRVLSTEVTEHSGRTYYQYELEPPHVFITATAAGNRLYLFSVTASGLQWKRHYKDLKQITDSFRVV